MLKRIRHTMCKVGLAGWFWLVLSAPGYTGLWQLQDRAGLLGLAVKLAVSVTVEPKTSTCTIIRLHGSAKVYYDENSH